MIGLSALDRSQNAESRNYAPRDGVSLLLNASAHVPGPQTALQKVGQAQFGSTYKHLPAVLIAAAGGGSLNHLHVLRAAMVRISKKAETWRAQALPKQKGADAHRYVYIGCSVGRHHWGNRLELLLQLHSMHAISVPVPQF